MFSWFNLKFIIPENKDTCVIIEKKYLGKLFSFLELNKYSKRIGCCQLYIFKKR